MTKLLDHLTKLVLQDNVIFFVGGSGHGEADDPPLARLAARLAAELGEDGERELAAVAQDYEAVNGRRALVQALREALDAAAGEQDTVAEKLARTVLPSTKIITTRFDQSLENALDAAKKSYVRIVRDDDVPFFDESRVTIIKMRGDISQVGSLVITESDLVTFFRQLPALSDVIRAFFATKTLVFLGYDLNSARFSRFYQQVTTNLSTFRRTAYAIVDEPLREAKAKYWGQQNMDVHVEPLGEFLQELADLIEREVTASGGPDSAAMVNNPLLNIAFPPLPERPYKALDSFTGADVAIFTGREEESMRLANRILANRLTLVYGESGSGKSSLLNAGVRPQLAQRRALLTNCTPAPHQSLADSIRAGVLTTSQRADLVPPSESDTDDLADFLRHWQRSLDAALVVVVDQFEQFFIAYSEAEQAAAAALLRDLHGNKELDLHLVIVMREDFIGRLQTQEKTLPMLLDVRYRLERLGVEAARAAIEEPAELFGMVWEEALVERLLADLQEGTRVAPPQLQIICDVLYRRAVEGREKRITLAQFEALGGTAAILGDYVEGVVAALRDDQQAATRNLLGALVGSSGVKVRLSLAELARAAEVDAAEALPILDELVRRRLVTRYETAAGSFDFELTHDILAVRISRWLGDAFWDRQRAREVLRMAAERWEREARLLDPSDLQLVQKVGVELVPNEEAVVYGSAVGYGRFAATGLDAAEQERVLLRLVDYPQTQVQQNVAQALSQFDSEEATSKLAELAVLQPYMALSPFVVAGIIQARNTAAVQKIIDLKTVGTSSVLARLQDRWPEVAAMLPEALKQPVRRAVWGLRWEREQQAIFNAAVRGAVFGFLGYGLAVGLFPGLSVANLRPFNFRLLVQVAFGLTGLFGLAGLPALGAGAFVHALVTKLGDGKGWLAWGLSTALTGLLLGAALLGLSTIAAGEPKLLETFLAGLLLGVATVAGGALPLGQGVRLGAAVLLGVAASFIIALTGLLQVEGGIWPPLMGIASGLCTFLAFQPRSTGVVRWLSAAV